MIIEHDVKPPLENGPSNSTSLARPGEVEAGPSPHVDGNSLERSPNVAINQEIGQEVDLPPPPYQAPGYYSQNRADTAQTQAYNSQSSESVNLEKNQKRLWLRRRAVLIALLSALSIVVVFLIIFLPVYFKVVKPHRLSSSSTRTVETRGGNGSRVVTEDGTEFVYSNPFGGFWVSDSEHPYDDNAQPNSWTPPLNTPWDYSMYRINGVNLAGLFVLEPLTTPRLFQKYSPAKDEWDLSVAMANDTAEGGGLEQIEEHYRTFITEEDIAEIAGAGLTWVRVPIGFWAIETFPGEPFLAKTSWKYILRLLQWCRKYGIRVNLALIAIPGSANGFNYGGKTDSLNLLRGAMGLANAQRTLYYIKTLAEFVSQPEWRTVVPMLSILNEPLAPLIGMDQLRSFYLEVYKTVRGLTLNGPYLVIHDGFGIAPYFPLQDGFMARPERIIVEKHQYAAFEEEDTDKVSSGSAQQVCAWGPLFNQSRADHGITMATEFSAAFLDCGLFLRSTRQTPKYQGDCTLWDEYDDWGLGIKSLLMQFVGAQMDALRDWFYFNWKIAPSAEGTIDSPLWSYQLGLQNGWIYSDPRRALNACGGIVLSSSPSLPSSSSSTTSTNTVIPSQQPPTEIITDSTTPPITRTWDGTYSPWMTGSFGAEVKGDLTKYPWPPGTTLSGLSTSNAQTTTLGSARGDTLTSNLPTPTTTTTIRLPTYTSTGVPIVLQFPTSAPDRDNNVGLNARARAVGPAPTPIGGCETLYPDAWDAVGKDFAGWTCSAGA